MELFGLSVEQLTQLLVAIATLIALVDSMWTKITHKNVKEAKTQIDETQTAVRELTNGKLKAAVKDAVTEVQTEKETENG